MSIINRSLSVTLDGEPLSFSGRIQLRGKDGLSLFLALFTLELWNLPEEMFLRLSRARNISVSHEDACLVSGRVWDVYRHGTGEGSVTSVSISLGLDLWEAAVSLSVSGGTAVSETVWQILTASGTSIPLLSFPDSDIVSMRSHSFFGRASECITEALTDASCRPMLTLSGLMVVPEGGLSEAVRITEADMTDAPASAGGTLRGTQSRMILSAVVSGWRPGQTVEMDYHDIHIRGIITEHSVDADTGDGAWKCELILELI